MMRAVASGFAFALGTTVLVAGHANASPQCENEAWNYCGSSIDRCCPPGQSFACINVRNRPTIRWSADPGLVPFRPADVRLSPVASYAEQCGPPD